MDIEKEVNAGLDALKKTAENTSDLIDEASHRSAADNEEAKRDVVGGAMTPGEKVSSIAEQAKESGLAEVDRAKRNIRNSV